MGCRHHPHPRSPNCGYRYRFESCCRHLVDVCLGLVGAVRHRGGGRRCVAFARRHAGLVVAVGHLLPRHRRPHDGPHAGPGPGPGRDPGRGGVGSGCPVHAAVVCLLRHRFGCDSCCGYGRHSWLSLPHLYRHHHHFRHLRQLRHPLP